MKKISVIVILYNTNEEYLRKCIDSIVNQTLKEIEIILINDGSTNHAQEVCMQYAKNDNRIIVINQENQGESVARNVGIKNATTDNILFVDSDDWIEKETCEKAYHYIENIKGQYDILVFNCYVDYVNKSIKNQFYHKTGFLTKEDIEELQLQNIEKGITKYYPTEANISSVWAKVYRKKFIEENKLEFIANIIRMPDALFNMEALEKAKRVYVMPEYLYHYQKNNFAICQKYSKDTIHYYETYIAFVKSYIQEYEKAEKFEDNLNIKILTSIDRYMYNYFFHKDNPKKKKVVTEEFKQLLESKLYQEAFKKVKKEYLTLYQKLVLRAAKAQNIKGLRMLKNTKDVIKFLQGKKAK